MSHLALIPIALLFTGILALIARFAVLIYDIWCDLCLPMPPASRAARFVTLALTLVFTLVLIVADLYLASIIYRA